MQKKQGFLMSPRTLTFVAVLVAMQVICTRFLSIRLGDTLRLSLGFVPTATAGMLFGPLPAALVGGLGDVVGFFLFPSGTYFPGFTLTAAVGGLIYGFLLYKKEDSLVRILLCKLLIDVVCNVLLNTLWLDLLYGKGFLAILPARLLKNALQYPVDVALLFSLGRLIKHLPASLRLR